MPVRLLLLLLPALLLPASAAAKQTKDLKPSDPGKFVFETSGEGRLNFSLLDDFAVDAEDPATTHGQERWLDSRVRGRFDLKIARLHVSTEMDIVSGVLAGDLWNLGPNDDRRRDIYGARGVEGFAPRRAALMLRWAHLDIEAGLVTSHWGLGLLAHGGGGPDPLFGRTDLGDRTFRFRVTGRPLLLADEPVPGAAKFNLTGAFDVVFDDDVGSLLKRQIALQGIVSAIVLDPGHCTHGVYVVYRNQTEPDDAGNTSVVVIDGYADRTLHLGEETTLRLAAEGAAVFGTTSRALTYNAREQLVVASGGVVGHATLGLLGGRIQVHGRAGLASGDADPDDKTSTAFTFDRNLDSGAVLYDHLLAGVNLGTQALVTDPGNSGYPPRGADALANEGAAGSTFFVQPAIQARPLDFLDLRAGVLLAFATADHRQAFYSFRAGGTPVNHHGVAVDDRFLGAEVNLAVWFGAPLPFKGENAPELTPQIGLQSGHLIVGPALADGGSEADVVNHLLVTGRFRW